MQDVVFVIIGLTVVVFAFVVGSIKVDQYGDGAEGGRRSELDAEHRRAGDLQAGREPGAGSTSG